LSELSLASADPVNSVWQPTR